MNLIMENNINIVASNCIGGRIYEENNSEYKSPFIWNVIKLSNFIKLILNYDKINLENISSYFTYKECKKDEYNNICSTILLDNKIKIYFIHHHYDINETVLTHKIERIKSPGEYDMVGNDILLYLEKAWKNRCKRIKSEPIFIYWDGILCNDCSIKKLLNIIPKLKYKLILISETDYSKYNNDKFIYVKKTSSNTKIMAKKIIESNII